jgi:alanine racemase
MFPATRMDMVRVGIIQYGLWPSPEVFVNFLSTRVKLILFKELLLGKNHECKNVKIGEFIGYGTSFLAEKKDESPQFHWLFSWL